MRRKAAATSALSPCALSEAHCSGEKRSGRDAEEEEEEEEEEEGEEGRRTDAQQTNLAGATVVPLAPKRAMLSGLEFF